MSDTQATTVLDNHGDQIRIEADGSSVLITFYGDDDGQPCVKAFAAAEMAAEAARDEEAGNDQ